MAGSSAAAHPVRNTGEHRGLLVGGTVGTVRRKGAGKALENQKRLG